MSKLDDLKRKFDQREYNRKWQRHYNDYCHNYLGGKRQAEGNEHDRAAAFADEMMEDE